MGLFDDIARGAGQGASLNLNDELSSAILSALPGPKDPDGIEREYAAGSRYNDYVQSQRGDNAAAAARSPIGYAAGNFAGALPAALASGGLGGSSMVGNAAVGAGLGAVAGAGSADGRDLGKATAQGALLGSVPMGGRHALGGTAQVLHELGGASAAAPRRAIAPRAPTGPVDVAPIPKSPKVPVRESLVPAADELAEAADVVHGNKMLGREHRPGEVERYVGIRDKVKAAKPAEGPKTVRPAKKAEPTATVPEHVEPELREWYAKQQKMGRDPAAIDRELGTKRDRLLEARPLPPVQQEFAGMDRPGAYPKGERLDTPDARAWSSNEYRNPEIGQRLRAELDARGGQSADRAFRGQNLDGLTLRKALFSGKNDSAHYRGRPVESWTTEPAIAEEFLKEGVGNKVVTRQADAKGLPIHGNSPREMEVLTTPSAGKDIAQVSQTPDGVYRMLLRDVPAQEIVAPTPSATNQLMLDLEQKAASPKTVRPGKRGKK